MDNPPAESSTNPGTNPNQGMSEEDIIKRLTPKDEPETPKPSQESAEEDSEDKEQEDKVQDEESQHDAAEDGEDAEPKPEDWLTKKHKITVQGEELEVTGDELRNGYMRQQDYTRKTQAHAEQAKEVAQAKQFIQREYVERTNKLEGLQSALYQALVGDQEVYAQLVEQGDVAGALKLQQDMNKRANLLRQAEENRLQIQAMQANHAESERKELAEAGQRALLEALPEWKDPAKYAAESADVARFLVQNGYADDDLNNLFDHRAVLIARKAMLYDKMQAVQAKKVTPVQEPPRAVKSGNANIPVQSKKEAEIQTLQKRFRKTGKDDDAVALLLARSK